jgi:hypothetical protein
MYFYKAYKYEYKAIAFLMEITGLIVLTAFQYFRLFLGSKGNKTEKSGLVCWFELCTIIAFGGMSYFMWAQSYVLLFEFIFAFVILILGLLEFISAGFASMEFKS